MTFLHRFGAISIKKSIILSVKIPKFSPSARSSDTKSPPIRNPDLRGWEIETHVTVCEDLSSPLHTVDLHREFQFTAPYTVPKYHYNGV